MTLGFDFWIQLLVVLAALFYGARKGGMGLGLIGGVGLVILIFVFHLKPGKPPVDVILTILSVVCASATLQAAGGLDCLLQIAEKMLRRHPRFVCYLAPYICCYCLSNRFLAAEQPRHLSFSFCKSVIIFYKA